MVLKNLTKLLLVFTIDTFFTQEGVTAMDQGLSSSCARIEDMNITQLIAFEATVRDSLLARQKSSQLKETSVEELTQLLNIFKFNELTIEKELFARDMYIRDISFKFISSPELKGPFAELEKAIEDKEIEFLDGSQKDLNFLHAGYDKLKSLNLENELEEFDAKLRDFYALSSHQSICRDLAEKCKELALSSQDRNHYFRAAFWFRLLYSIGAHSSYFDEYKKMIVEARK